MKPIYDLKKILDQDPKKLVEQVKQEISNLRKYIILRYPFFFPLLKHLKVRITNIIETAGVDGKYLVINPYFFASLPVQDKIFVLLHETLHLALRHYEKIQKKTYKMLYNISADAIINEMLFSFDIKPCKLLNQIITKETIEKLSNGEIPANDVPKLSADEIYYRLLRVIKDLDKYRNTSEFIEQNEGSEEQENEGEGGENESRRHGKAKCKGMSRKTEERQKESKERGEGGGRGEKQEIDEKVEYGGGGEIDESVLEDVYNLAKTFGKLPAEFEIIIEKIRKAKINWKQLLRLHLSQVFGTKVISDWRRINRKLPEIIAGYRRYNDKDTIKELIAIVDLSGSVVMEKEVLEQFFSELWYIVQHFRAKLRIITFDAVVNSDREIKSLEELKNFMNNIKGGGGTIPDIALKYLLEKIQFNRNKKIAIVMLTDGIFEVNKELCDKVASLVTKAIYVYTLKENKEEFSRWVRVRLVV